MGASAKAPDASPVSGNEPGQQAPPRLVRALHHPLVLAPVRLTLSALVLGLAFVAGARAYPVLLAWALGAFLGFFVLSVDRRFLLLERHEPARVPAGASIEPWWRVLATDIFPSTAGLTALAAVALSTKPVLAAVLAGILSGMGIASVLGYGRVTASEQRAGARLYYERRSGRPFYEAPEQPGRGF